MPKIAIIGTTTWGITLGVVAARKGLQVNLWARTEQEASELTNSGHDRALVPGKFPAKLAITSSLSEALDDVRAVIIVVPSQSVRQNTRLISDYLDDHMFIVSAAKGLEVDSSQRMSQVIAEEIDPRFRSNICVLSGPNLFQEILNGLPAATVVASNDEAAAQKVQKLLISPKFCIYTNTDVVGVELGGALKNIIALGAGMADGLGYGDNAKAALITRGLTEVTAFGVAQGANPLTFSGLAGFGDLIATCASPLSRNHYVGEELAKGRPLAEITESMAGVAEGVSTTLVVWKLAQKMGLEMPITEAIYRILYQGAGIRQAADELMNAGAAHELAGRKWRLASFLRPRRRS